jgi:hypothetical protein
MSRPTHRTLAATLGIALVALLALPLAVFANTSEAIAQTGGMSVTLPMPLPGTGLSVVVKLDAVGNVSQVALDPVGTYSATKLGPHAVTFDNADGTSRVKINAKGDALSVKASVPTLASLLGSGKWSADLFGTHEPTTVDYTVGDSAGAPTIAIDSVAAPVDVAVVQGTPKMTTGPKGSDASVRVEFSRNGFTKKLDIRVSVKAGGERPASLRITLSGKDRQRLAGTLEQLVGTRTWAGHLCDGTPVSFGYEVVATGTVGSVVFGTASAPTTVKTNEHGFTVGFDGTKTRVKVQLVHKPDTSWELTVSARADKCKHTPAADPTVNTPVKPGTDQGHNGHDGSAASARIEQGKGDTGSGDRTGSGNGSSHG